MQTLYTVKGPPGRSHSTTSEVSAKRTFDEWKQEGYDVSMSERPYEPVVQDRAYWLSIYPDGNFPEGI